MAQLGVVRAERDALEAKREALQKSFSFAAEALHDVMEGLRGEQHELAGRYKKIAVLLQTRRPFPRVVAQRREHAKRMKPILPLSKAHAHRMADLHSASMWPLLRTVRQ